jgi:hypothetical protein
MNKVKRKYIIADNSEWIKSKRFTGLPGNGVPFTLLEEVQTQNAIIIDKVSWVFTDVGDYIPSIFNDRNAGIRLYIGSDIYPSNLSVKPQADDWGSYQYIRHSGLNYHYGAFLECILEMNKNIKVEWICYDNAQYGIDVMIRGRRIVWDQ